MSPLVQLSLWQIKNTILSALKSPKKLIPALFFLGYILWISWSWTHAGQRGGFPPEILRGYRANRDSIQTGTFLFLCLFAIGLIDKGFSGGSLRFLPADIDYLFAAPFSRRRVLFAKLFQGMSVNFVLMAAYLVYLAAGGGHKDNMPGWVAYSALGLCYGGYTNIAVVIELIFALNRWVFLRRLILLGLVCILVWVGDVGWQHGLRGVTELGHHGVLPILFYPCLLAAQAITSGLAEQGTAMIWPLILFYLVTVALIFSRNENYYEAALTGSERIWQAAEAARENPLRLLSGKKRAVSESKLVQYSLRPFGRGAGAVIWAHLAAAAKRPFLNFGVPVLVGVVTVLLGLRGGDVAVAFLAFYYLAGTSIFGGLFAYRHSLRRQPLIRPLPLTARQAVIAEIAPRFLLALPFYVIAALGTLITRGTDEIPLTMLLLCLPAVSLCFHLLQYTLVLWYPGTEDKLQSLITNSLQFLMVVVLLGVLGIYALIPERLGAPNWLTLLIFFSGTLLTAAFLWILTTGAYADHQPEGSPVRIDKAAMKRFFKPVLAGGVLLGIVGSIGARINAAHHPPPMPLPATVTARRGDLTVEVSETGTLLADNQVDIKSKVAGRILDIPIHEGEFIHQGQLIARIDRSLLDPQIAQARASLSQAQARLQQTISQYHLQQVQTHMAIAQAKAGLHSAQTHLAAVKADARPQEIAEQQMAVQRAQIAQKDAQRTYDRKAALLAKGFVAQATLDTAQTALDTARSNLNTAQQSLALTQAGPRLEDIRDAEAQVNIQRIALAAAQTNAGQNEVSRSDVMQARASVQQMAGALNQLLVSLHDTEIVAPTSGILMKKDKEPNEIVQSATTGFSDSQSTVATLGSHLLVQVGINEMDIPKVRLGEHATIHVDSLPEKAFTGVVTEIAPASTEAFDTSGSGQSGISKFWVKVAFRHADPQLKPGMSAVVDILSARRKHVVLVPVDALPFAGSHGQVTLLLLSGTLRKRSVIIGIRNNRDAEVLKGIYPGEKLVTVH